MSTFLTVVITIISWSIIGRILKTIFLRVLIGKELCEEYNEFIKQLRIKAIKRQLIIKLILFY